MVHIYGDTTVPWLADTPGFRETLFADPADGQLISQTGWRDPAARAASPSVAEMIRSNVLADDDCQIRAVEDYRLVFDSAREPAPSRVMKPRITVRHVPMYGQRRALRKLKGPSESRIAGWRRGWTCSVG